MGKRQVDWARRKRLELELLLGLVCALCGKKRKKLQFDCIIPQGDHHHRIGFTWRMSFYWAQYKAKNLQLLCQKCHDKKNLQDKQTHPF